jgi:aryl-alcohol dehydrogenase-like predicted oxidoreductase
MNPSNRRIGPFQVHPVGLGCMNLSHAYAAPPPPEAAERLLLTALDLGANLVDTAALYGFGANETLVGRVLKAHRSCIVLCTKGGMAGEPVGEGGALQRVIDGRPATIRRHCEDSLRRLGVDVIDLYYLHRWDKAVPVEDSVGEMARLVERGHVRTIGLSEVSAATLRRAHAVHPITAVQSEYSLWSRNPELGVLAACREIGAAFVAFSPTGRGLFTSAPPDPAAFAPRDIRRAMPRFEPANWAANLKLRARVAPLADEAGCTLAQLALAWVLARGEHVIALPGTTQEAHLRENLAAAGVTLAPALIAKLDAICAPAAVAGARYNPQNASEVDTEDF